MLSISVTMPSKPSSKITLVSAIRNGKSCSAAYRASVIHRGLQRIDAVITSKHEVDLAVWVRASITLQR